MSETELAGLGFNKIVWNNVIPEYWVSIAPLEDGYEYDFDYRLGVRFNEHPADPVKVYLVAGRCMIRLRYITTVRQLLQMYELLSGRKVTG